MTIEDIFSKYQCRPIPGCPGRWIIRDSQHLTIREICGENVKSEEFVSKAVPDPVIICKFGDGGIISYRKPDGTIVHTLNNKEGFERKCGELGSHIHNYCPSLSVKKNNFIVP